MKVQGFSDGAVEAFCFWILGQRNWNRWGKFAEFGSLGVSGTGSVEWEKVGRGSDFLEKSSV
ncbi:MAG: hypothetical protein ACLFPR_19840, partial [Desulfococcaceae bacterium]